MIPPLSQSRQKLLACPRTYVEQVILGNKEPNNEYSLRGRAIHSFLSAYVNYLVRMKSRKDPQYFEDSLQGVEPSARAILAGMDEMEIDPENVWGTEMRIRLTPEFGVCTNGEAEHEGTLDLVELLDDSTAQITDYKSQWQAVEADTFQARFYAMLLFCINPRIQEVRFLLRFLRWGTDKLAVYKREDLEALQAEAKVFREYQLALHRDAQSHAIIEPIPGNHCVYCPLLSAGCPIEKNPYTDPSGHLMNALYFKKALEKSKKILKDHADKEPVEYKDGAAVRYVAQWQTQIRKKFGLDALPTLMEWQKAHEKDLLLKLSLSGLSNLLKAKKRQELSDKCAAFCEPDPVAKFHIGKAGEEEHEDE